MYKLCFYVPATHLEAVKAAVFAAGAGRFGDYDSCCWQVLGQGQFRPLAGSDPFLGRQGEVEQVEEYRVEMVCERAVVGAAVAAMKQAHPYEEPAWDVVELVTELPGG
ncbi:MAG: NGG1p interacting factor NIF3 [Halioglobus sp.]